MARVLTPSLLDRLIDDDHASPLDRHQHDDGGMARIKVALRRDLESLLNTGRPWLPVTERYAGLDGTIITYGIPDLSTEDMSVPTVRERTRLAIARVIAEHEPRLSKVEVEVDDKLGARGLHLRIGAVLALSQNEERVFFEANVRPGDRAIDVALPS